MTERQLINAIKKALEKAGVENYDGKSLKAALKKDPDAVYDFMIDCYRAVHNDTFLELAEEVVVYEQETIAAAKEAATSE